MIEIGPGTDDAWGAADEALAGPIVISLREARLVVERILQLSPLDSGMIPSVADAVLYSQMQGGGGFQALLDCHANLTCGQPPDPYDPVSIVCHGVHAWVVAPGLADLTVELAFAGGGSFLATSIAAIGELAILPALIARHGVAAEIEITGGDAVRIQVEPAAGQPGRSQMDGVMWRMVKSGFPVLGTLWWRLYHVSNTALAADNPVSRRHAGHLIVQDDGSVIGRRDVDDDTDLRLFLAAQADSITPPPAGDIA